MEVTLIDKQKYLAELTKLLSGMAPADRDAVLAGISARFDKELSDGEVIRSLGSPTFAAVSVLRNYVPPEEREEQEEPAPDVMPEPAVEVEPEPVSETGSENAAPEQQAATDGLIEPEPMPQTLDEAVPEAVSEPETAPEPELTSQVDAETITEPENAAPEQQAAVDGLIEPEPMPETLDEAAQEDTPETEAEAEKTEVLEGLDFPDIEALLEVEAEAEGESEAEPLSESMPEPEAIPEWLGEPLLEEDKPAETKSERREGAKIRVGRLILYILGAVVVGIPATLFLVIITLALLCLGVGLAFSGVFVISFCFLGMTVVSDILLCAGAGMVMIGLALPVLYFALLFFMRCVIGFVNLVIREGSNWCYEPKEVDG